MPVETCLSSNASGVMHRGQRKHAFPSQASKHAFPRQASKHAFPSANQSQPRAKQAQLSSTRLPVLFPLPPPTMRTHAQGIESERVYASMSMHLSHRHKPLSVSYTDQTLYESICVTHHDTTTATHHYSKRAREQESKRAREQETTRGRLRTRNEEGGRRWCKVDQLQQIATDCCCNVDATDWSCNVDATD